MLDVDVSIGPYHWLGRSPSHHEVLTPVQLLLRLQNHHHHTQSVTTTTTTSQTSLAMDQEEKKQVQSIIDQLKGHSLPDGGEIVGSINLSSSEFTATNNRAHIVRQYESGSTASERKTARETPDRKGITFSLFRLEDLRQYFVRKFIISVSVCRLLAIILLCSIVSQLVRSSTQPSASQQVEIVQRILLSLSDDFAATIDNSPYEGIKYQGIFRSYEETKKPPEKPKEPEKPKAPVKPKEPEKPKPPPKAPEKPKEPENPNLPPKRGQIKGRWIYFPSALSGGGKIGGPIALSLSESAATKNIAQCVGLGQAQSGYDASDSENERTREQGDPEEINATITSHDIMRHYGRRNREDAAASLAISVSTFKRKCRGFGIKRWPDVRKRKVGRPPNQHGEGNTSTARETPLHYVQTGMEGELVGQNEVANVFQREFMGGPIALNTESGLIMGSRPPDQHGERNTSTACGTPSRNVETGMEVEPVGQNQEANVFRRDFMYGPIALNTDGLTFPECSDAVAPSQPMATILDTIPHLNGGSSECAFQVKNQSTQFTANPYPNGLVNPHPQIALTQILSENMERLEDRRNLFAPQKVPFPEGQVFGFVNWTVRSCSDVALSQPMPTIPHTTECSEYWRNSLALLEEHLLEENDYGSINLTAPSWFDPGLSQPMHTIPHTMPTIPQMMPLLTERQDMRSVRLKATYGNTTIKFPLPSGFSELKEEVSKRLEFEHGSFKLEYKDEEGDSVLIACDEDVRDYLRLLTSLGNQVVKLFVLDKVPNTTNFCDNCGCDNCRSLKCKRP